MVANSKFSNSQWFYEFISSIMKQIQFLYWTHKKNLKLNRFLNVIICRKSALGQRRCVKIYAFYYRKHTFPTFLNFSTFLTELATLLSLLLLLPEFLWVKADRGQSEAARASIFLSVRGEEFSVMPNIQPFIIWLVCEFWL